MKWQLLQTGFLSGELNMEIDVALAERLNEEQGGAVLRLYGWNPPAISIGYNQDISEFDAKKLAHAGIDLVRRPTGGRAILHWNELTYSAIMPIEQKGLKEIYHYLNLGLLEGVRLLGIEAELFDSGSTTSQMYYQTTSAACFSSTANSEIQYQGRKLIGSAQRKIGNVVLQHGSLLLGPQHLEISSMLSDENIARQSSMKQHLLEHAIDAKTILGREVTFEESSICIRAGFERAHDITFEEPSDLILDAITIQTTVQ
ncbi:MAG: lipoate--protein ligase family protein [Ignavibacteriae bacterium]|nr:lipoate--protein ligase family protein [Ignavibacteriota bacterium]